MTGVRIEPRYSIKDAAKLTSLSVTTINRAIAAGTLQAHRMGERRTVIRAMDLQAFIEATERPLSQAPVAVAAPPAKHQAPKPRAAKRARG